MSKFKVGDKVRRISKYYPTSTVDGHTMNSWPLMHKGGIYEVIEVDETGISEPLIRVKGSQGWWWEEDFETVVVNSVEEAKALLEAEGYTITPPKSGKAYIIQFPGCEPIPVRSLGGYDPKAYKLLAVVDWVEGMGLSEAEK